MPSIANLDPDARDCGEWVQRATDAEARAALLQKEVEELKARLRQQDDETGRKDICIQASPTLTANQDTLDHHLLLSYANDISEASTTLIPNQPTTPTAAIPLITRHIPPLLSLALTSTSLQTRTKELEARLRARDSYLQKAIMDTARQVSDLEHQVMELEGVNEELTHRMNVVEMERERLEEVVEELDEDNLALQNELGRVGDVGGGVPASPEGSGKGTLGRDDVGGETGGEGWSGWMDEYVLLRDIGCQTDPSPEETKPKSATISTQTPSQTSSALTILTLTTRLTYQHLLIETHLDTITELESQLSTLKQHAETLEKQNWEMKVRCEHLQAVGDVNSRMMDEVLSRVRTLEERHSSKLMIRSARRLMESSDLERTQHMMPEGYYPYGYHPGQELDPSAMAMAASRIWGIRRTGSGSSLRSLEGLPVGRPPRSPLPPPPSQQQSGDGDQYGIVAMYGDEEPAPDGRRGSVQRSRRESMKRLSIGNGLKERAGMVTPPPPRPTTPNTGSFRFQQRKPLVATPPEVHRASVELHRASLEQENGLPLGDGVSVGGPNGVMVGKGKGAKGASAKGAKGVSSKRKKDAAIAVEVGVADGRVSEVKTRRRVSVVPEVTTVSRANSQRASFVPTGAGRMPTPPASPPPRKQKA
ncbi:hypothetical protein HK097_002323 [Rhizophlyctis rosea]|uniref:Uncharacterized protein n=1 Tax=Rhizophlyctis rosea TaxID=64517 RepID=A0AAD5X948_9FUNG|nr:hypothetical protein HK097_002323 [Rhizophlyctis rosea]